MVVVTIRSIQCSYIYDTKSCDYLLPLATVSFAMRPDEQQTFFKRMFAMKIPKVS